MQIASSFYAGEKRDEETSLTDYLTHVDQKISDWLIKIMILGEVKTEIRSGIKSRFRYCGFLSQMELFSACSFLFNNF